MIKKNKIRFGILYESLNFNLMENRPLKDNNLQFLYIVLTDDCKLLYYNSDKYLKMNCHEIVGFEYDGSERIIQLYRLSDFHIIKDSSIYFRYKGKTPLDDSEIGYYHIGKDEYNEMLLHEKVLFEQKIKSYNYNRGKPTKEYYCTIDKKHIYKLSKRESFLIEYSEIHNSLKVKSEAFIATPFSEHKFNFTNYLKDLYDKEKKRITSLNINDIIDSYKLSMNTIYLTKNGGDDSINVVEESECIYRDEYLDTLLPFVQSDLYYDRGYGCLEFKEADKERKLIKEKEKKIKEEAIRNYNQDKHISVFFYKKVCEEIYQYQSLCMKRQESKEELKALEHTMEDYWPVGHLSYSGKTCTITLVWDILEKIHSFNLQDKIDFDNFDDFYV